MEGKMLTTIEIVDIQKTIEEIGRILYSIPFRADEARAKICEVNAKHPDNLVVHGIIFPSSNNGTTTIAAADYARLQADLQWKQYYLQAKQLGKTVNEMIKELHAPGEPQQ